MNSFLLIWGHFLISFFDPSVNIRQTSYPNNNLHCSSKKKKKLIMVYCLKRQNWAHVHKQNFQNLLRKQQKKQNTF